MKYRDRRFPAAIWHREFRIADATSEAGGFHIRSLAECDRDVAEPLAEREETFSHPATVDMAPSIRERWRSARSGVPRHPAIEK